MLQLAIEGPAGSATPRAIELVDGVLVLGSRPAPGVLVLPHASVAAHHVRLVTRGSTVVIANTGIPSRAVYQTVVDGIWLDAPLRLLPRHRVEVGVFALRLVTDVDFEHPFAPRDDAEARLLDAIAAGEPDSRAIYADWLDAREDAARAGFLRATAPPPPELAPRGDHRWRLRVAAPPIETCAPYFQFKCPKQWSELQRTAADDRRWCDACHKPVFYCETVVEARAHAAMDECVALDAAAVRADNDLDKPPSPTRCPACGYTGDSSLERTCQRCGTTYARSTVPPMVGMMAPPVR